MGKNSKLDAKIREIIALGVAAQIPCAYYVYVHTKNAKAEGASGLKSVKLSLRKPT
jgi:AhpD family alkylhydroperoxidase